MTERKPANVSFGDWVEGQIRQADQQGQFDNLPGRGEPLASLPDSRDDMAWIAAKLRRENADIQAILPPSLALAKEVEDLPERLGRERSERGVRAVVEDLNARILLAYRLPQEGPPMRVMTRDVDAEVAGWRAARDALTSDSAPPLPLPLPLPLLQHRNHGRGVAGSGAGVAAETSRATAVFWKPGSGVAGGRGALGVVGLVICWTALSGCGSGSTTPPPITPSTTSASAATSAGAATSASAPTGSALAAVDTLTVKGRAPKTGYSREQFGPAWADVDRNGCDTRNDILRRDLKAVAPGAGCVVASGRLDDPYTGNQIDFVRGNDTSTAVQIDHVVALSDSWQKGAQQWSAAIRQAFANDPLNLFAVDGPTNVKKGDGDTATWLPPNTAFRCEYVARQVSVKVKYQAWVTAAERDAMTRVLSACPDQPLLPANSTAGVASSSTAPAVASPPGSTPVPGSLAPVSPPPAAATGSGVYYANCAQARAAGAAPLHVGEPGYRAALDADHDGVACE